MKAGIPTTYRDVRFRSRLEAKWAAMFDLLGWRWEYEPFDLPGWIPDFLLPDAGVLVEVKPVNHFPSDVAAKIERAIPVRTAETTAGVRLWPTYEAMILGHSCPINSGGIEASDGKAIGWLRATPMVWHPEHSPMWGRGIVQIFNDAIPSEFPNDHFGLYHECDPEMQIDAGFTVNKDTQDRLYTDRFFISGAMVFWGIGSSENCMVAQKWRQAGNPVQWNGTRSSNVSMGNKAKSILDLAKEILQKLEDGATP